MCCLIVGVCWCLSICVVFDGGYVLCIVCCVLFVMWVLVYGGWHRLFVSTCILLVGRVSLFVVCCVSSGIC